MNNKKENFNCNSSNYNKKCWSNSSNNNKNSSNNKKKGLQ